MWRFLQASPSFSSRWITTERRFSKIGIRAIKKSESAKKNRKIGIRPFFREKIGMIPIKSEWTAGLHTCMQTRRQHTEHHLRTSFAGLVDSASVLDLTVPSKPNPRSLFATYPTNENALWFSLQWTQHTLITCFHSKHKIWEVIINSSSPPAQEHWYRLTQCLNSFHYPPL